jgi:hypothetical protein
MPTTFNTTDPKPGYVYDSATDTWFPLLGIAPGSSVVRWRKTAAGAETSVSGLDDLGATLSYNAGTEQVYLNGVLLVRTEDYLATTGTSITGLTALAASDVIEVIAFNATNVQITDALLETDINAKGDLIVGAAVDTAAILSSGTNGQVLSVNTATATGLEWVTSDDANAIQNAIVDAKGDIITATAADTPARLAVGADGTMLVADSSAATGLSYQNNFTAGKNKIINGDFNVNQRNFTTATAAAYGFDRWRYEFSTGTNTYSAQTFTLGAAPVAGYEGKNFAQMAISGQSATSAYNILGQRIEDVRTFAGQTVTFSFWAKASSGTPSIGLEITQVFGTGGSPSAFVSTPLGSITTSTSWTRYSKTVAVPSISGKTIGTDANSSFIEANLWLSAGSDHATRASSIGINNSTFQIWGVQVEAGSTATAFQTATGTIQGELAACQRYYYRQTAGTLYAIFGTGYISTSTSANFVFPFPVTMRTVASSAEAANVEVIDFSNGTLAASSPSLAVTELSPQVGKIGFTISGGTAGRGANIRASNNAAAYVAFSAEL